LFTICLLGYTRSPIFAAQLKIYFNTRKYANYIHSWRTENGPLHQLGNFAPLAEAAKQRGTHVYHLNIGVSQDLP